MSNENFVKTTVVQIPSVVDLVTFHDDLDADDVVDMLSGVYSFIENCSYSETISEDGQTKTIVFTEKLGTKGGN